MPHEVAQGSTQSIHKVTKGKPEYSHPTVGMTPMLGTVQKTIPEHLQHGSGKHNGVSIPNEYVKGAQAS